MYKQTDLLGPSHSCKILAVAQFGDTREQPTVTRFVLRAWSLWRMTFPARFLDTRPDCKDEWHKQVKALSREIAESHQPLNSRAMQLLR